MRVAVVHVVDAVAAAEVAADRDRILAQFPRHAAIKRDSVCRAVHNLDQVLPSIQRGHDLLRSAA